MTSFEKLMRRCLKRHRSCALGSYSLARAVKWRALEDGKGVRTGTPRGLVSDLVSRITSLGVRLIGLGAQAAAR